MKPLLTHFKCYFFNVFLILCFSWLVNCVPRTRNLKVNSINKFKGRTGEPIAANDLIQKWEYEHQNLCQMEATNEHFTWEAMENKNMNEYCRKYLHQCVPRRTTHDAIGFTHFITLHYGIENTRKGKFVEILTCKTKKTGLMYHMTRAPEPNCVYSLRCNRGGPILKSSIYFIINKHCDFEEYDYIIHLKKKKVRNELSHLDEPTGQPIAIDKLLKQHEIDHQKLCKMEAANIAWPHVTTHNNINEYCRKYVQKSISSRNYKNITGSWKHGTVKYYKENAGKLSTAVILHCADSTNRVYYLTRALESNCAYAVLHSESKLKTVSYQIIYKHCNFEHTSVKFETLEDHRTSNMNILPVKNMKLEDSSELETLQLFPQS